VKAKAEKDDAVLEPALAYVLTGNADYALRARKHLLHDAREQTPHYEKIDVVAEPEWGRWTWWGAIAWAYDLTCNTFTAEERGEIEQWLRLAGTHDDCAGGRQGRPRRTSSSANIGAWE
jgi:hypothetical protein